MNGVIFQAAVFFVIVSLPLSAGMVTYPQPSAAPSIEQWAARTEFDPSQLDCPSLRTVQVTEILPLADRWYSQAEAGPRVVGGRHIDVRLIGVPVDYLPPLSWDEIEPGPAETWSQMVLELTGRESTWAISGATSANG